MKIKALALLVPALLMAGAGNAAEMYNKDGNKVDLYGKVDARHTFSDNAGDDGDATYVQIGFKGETQITEDLIGYGQWEYKTYANDTEGAGDKSFNRLAFAGLKFANYGSFDYGRNYGSVYDIEGWTDMLPVFGGDSYTLTDNFMVGRTNGVATYRALTNPVPTIRKVPKTATMKFVSRTVTATACPPRLISLMRSLNYRV